jgi:hypothetical protein
MNISNMDAEGKQQGINIREVFLAEVQLNFRLPFL